MADSRDITGKNRTFTGSKGIKLPADGTSTRVDESGVIRFNTDLNLAEYYDGTSWKSIDAPPTISSASPSFGIYDGSTLTTVTVNGSGFANGATVKFENSGGTQYTSASTTFVSSTQLTAQTTLNMVQGQYTIVVTNPSNLFGSLGNAFTLDRPPTFATAENTNIGSFTTGQTDFSGLTSIVATDPDGDTVTHTVSAGSLPSGVSLNTNGTFTGTAGSLTDSTDNAFTVKAVSGDNATIFTERQFKYDTVNPEYVAATGGSIATSGDYKIHTFSSSGTFAVTQAGNASGSNTVEYLVIAGGGQGASDNGGGAGAGGFRTNFPASPDATGGLAVTATSYPITIGGGGTTFGTLGVGESGSKGSDSTFATITSTGGGAAGHNETGGQGGSGGGTGQAGPGSSSNGNQPPVSPPQGNPGHQTPIPVGPGGGGGGGAGQPGFNIQSQTVAGPGGDGTSNSITGSTVQYAGGGAGGGGQPATWNGGPGGAGGGGNGGSQQTGAGQAGTANRGGGGGGGSQGGVGGAGGSGVVIIRYKFQ